MVGVIKDVHAGNVGQDRISGSNEAVVFMNVAADKKARTYPGQATGQGLGANMMRGRFPEVLIKWSGGPDIIEHAPRRTMGNEDVDIGRDHPAVFSHTRLIPCKGPAAESTDPGHPPDLQAIDLDSGVFEIVDRESLGEIAPLVCLHAEVVVAGDQDSFPGRNGFDPGPKVRLDPFHLPVYRAGRVETETSRIDCCPTTGRGRVAGNEQEIAFRHLWQEAMKIGCTDQPHRS